MTPSTSECLKESLAWVLGSFPGGRLFKTQATFDFPNCPLQSCHCRVFYGDRKHLRELDELEFSPIRMSVRATSAVLFERPTGRNYSVNGQVKTKGKPYC